MAAVQYLPCDLSLRGVVLVLLASTLGCGGCAERRDGHRDPDASGADVSFDVGLAADATLDPDRPFEATQPANALHKVKTFLVGVAPREAEYDAYAADSEVLPQLIDGWMELPEFEPRVHQMLTFMFQQHAGSDEIGLYMREQNTDVFQQREGRGGVDLEAAMRQSWALTAWDIIDEGRSFTEVNNTRTYYLNVPLMMALGYLDVTPRDDTNAYVGGYSWLEDLYPDLVVTYTQGEQIPWSESVDPASANFGRFSIGTPDGSAAGSSACDGLGNTFTGRAAIEEVFKRMMGVPFRTTCWSWNGAMANVFTDEDRVMRPITIRPPQAGEQPTLFWDLDALRTADELVLTTEYVGFFGSLGFLTQWTTNAGNEHRVTANQTLIVALGRTFDPGDLDVDPTLDDADHATPGTGCYGCHVTLDPLRDFFRQSYSYYGSARIDGMGANEDVPAVASFSIGGSQPIEGFGVGDLGDILASAERFAPAWTEKMCTLVNAGRCDLQDPELARIAQVFVESDHDFRVLLRELLSSPVVTYQERTSSWELHGEAVGSALRDDFCRRLRNRLGVDDPCSQNDELDAQPGVRDAVAGFAGVISAAGYPRGAIAPDLPIGASLFSTAGVENLCEALAGEFFNGRGGGRTPIFEPADRADAIDFFLTELMGVWQAHANAADLRGVLDAHWDEVLAETGDEGIALQSTFVLACSTPQTASVGF